MSGQQSQKRPRGSSDETDKEADLLKAVESFQAIPNPEVKDLSSILIDFIKYSVGSNKRLDQLETDIARLEDTVEAHSQDIVNNNTKITQIDADFKATVVQLNETIKSLETKCATDQSRNESSINIAMQSKIDNDLIIRGFPAKPDSSVVLQNFLTTFDLEPSNITSCYYFPYKPRNNIPTHNIIITFKEKDRKINLLSRKSAAGPLLLRTILPETPDTSTNVLHYTNRLTKFNLYAANHLNKAKSKKKLVKLRFHNLCFEVKETEDGDWQRITNGKELDKFMIPESESEV